MEYYSASKRKEILTHFTIGMNLENIKPSEIRQSPKTLYCMISLTQSF